MNDGLTIPFPLTRPMPFATDAADDPETAKTLHSTIRWNKIADVKIMVDSEVGAFLPDVALKKAHSFAATRKSVVHSRHGMYIASLTPSASLTPITARACHRRSRT